jgi:hypothetical protein
MVLTSLPLRLGYSGRHRTFDAVSVATGRFSGEADGNPRYIGYSDEVLAKLPI